MHSPIVTHTLNIFESLGKRVPPLVPNDIKNKLTDFLNKARLDLDLSLYELERMMVEAGKHLWPYNKAFLFFLKNNQSLVGEKFLLKNLDPSLKRRYAEYKEYGGSLEDLEKGRKVQFFSEEERANLKIALLRLREDLWKYTEQVVLSVERPLYEKKINEFKNHLLGVEEKLSALLELSEREKHNREMHNEIISHVEAIEHGFCHLGPAHKHTDIAQTEEHFVGRVEEKKIRRK